MVACYGQEQPEVDINEEMVKRSLAIYLNGARERRENDNDLAADDDDLTSDATAGRRFSSSGRNDWNRFVSIDTNYEAEQSSVSSITSITSTMSYGREKFLKISF